MKSQVQIQRSSIKTPMRVSLAQPHRRLDWTFLDLNLKCHDPNAIFPKIEPPFAKRVAKFPVNVGVHVGADLGFILESMLE